MRVLGLADSRKRFDTLIIWKADLVGFAFACRQMVAPHESDSYGQSLCRGGGSGGFVPSAVASLPELRAGALVDFVASAVDWLAASVAGTTNDDVAQQVQPQSQLRMTLPRMPRSLRDMD